MTRVEFLGHPVDNPSMEGAIAAIEGFIAEGAPHYIVAMNPAKLWRMDHSPELAAIVRAGSLLIPEKAIVIGARILGLPVRHHVGGCMLLERFLPVAENKGYRLYFLGAKTSVLDLMVQKLRKDYPKLQIAGYHDGYLSEEEDQTVTRQIQELRPDVLLIAMGTPKQEFWISAHYRALRVPVCMGVGGTFDVLAGVKRDAPGWVRSIAMEWLFRLIQDPKNLWKRYLTTMPWFLLRVMRARVGLAEPKR